MHGEGGYAWQRGVCVAMGGLCGKEGGHMRAGETATEAGVIE